jgi:hypothetical protein
MTWHSCDLVQCLQTDNIRASTSPIFSKFDHDQSISPLPLSNTMGRRKTKTHEQNLARVRNNQRSHRKRVKEHIAELGKELERLREALLEKEERIFELNAELERAEEKILSLEGLKDKRRPEAEINGSPATLENEILQHLDDGIVAVPTSGDTYVDIRRHTNSTASNPEAPQTFRLESKPWSIPQKKIPCCTSSPSPPSTPATESQSYIHTLSLTNQNQLPTAAPLESTTPCSEAYVLIDQQNFRSIDVEAIYVLLTQGFRRGMGHGDGCRVENGRLFDVLDFISGV